MEVGLGLGEGVNGSGAVAGAGGGGKWKWGWSWGWGWSKWEGRTMVKVTEFRSVQLVHFYSPSLKYGSFRFLFVLRPKLGETQSAQIDGCYLRRSRLKRFYKLGMGKKIFFLKSINLVQIHIAQIRMLNLGCCVLVPCSKIKIILNSSLLPLNVKTRHNVATTEVTKIYLSYFIDYYNFRKTKAASPSHQLPAYFSDLGLE